MTRRRIDSVNKHAFLAARTCPTMGWFAARAPDGERSYGTQWLLYAGREVGRHARQWLGAGPMLQRPSEAAALEATAAALADPGATLLFEATFRAGALVARADAMRRTGAGWQVVEVKSGTSPKPGKGPKDDHLDDLAYTVMVAQAAGLTVTGASLVLLNREHRLGDSEPMLVELDVSAEVLPRATELAAEAGAIEAAVTGDAAPEAALIRACKECAWYESDCLGRGVDDPIWILPNLHASKFEALAGYGRLAALPGDVALSAHQRRVFSAIRAGREDVDHEVLARLDELRYPLLYLDFEAATPFLPWFEGDAPYTTVPFQYSVHVRRAPGAPLQHHAYLAELEGDWRRDLATSLLEVLGDAGSIVTYSSYEQVRLQSLMELFPDLAAPLGGALERLFDLEKVVKHGWVHPGFGGRSSIKKVLPVVAPALDYADLAIGDGTEAAALFSLMRVREVPASAHAGHRADMLAYCARDTEAMVLVHEALEARRG